MITPKTSISNGSSPKISLLWIIQEIVKKVFVVDKLLDIDQR